ncbi:MAG: trypsin-like peptidase domain-containing protein, partial [Deltaproteobacteria bacterium]|nr:trypsin-like peptidase domain-containing protein [Deltaproteobacteria bacterium]
EYTVKVRVSTPIPLWGDRKGSTVATGFVVDSSRGWILTNAHVVGRSPGMLGVAFSDSDYVEARRVYVDGELDLAVIQALTGKRRQAQLDCSGKAASGIPVIAYGHPQGNFFVGTRGIVSAVNSELKELFGSHLQIDAPLNGGNSGSAVINLNNGKVVGVVTAQMKGAQNMGFALEIRQACRIIELLRKGIDPSPPVLAFQCLRNELAKAPLVIAEITSDSERKLKSEDVIKAIRRSKNAPWITLRDKAQLIDEARGALDSLSLKIARKNRELEITPQWQKRKSCVSRCALMVSGAVIQESEGDDVLDLAKKPSELAFTHVVEGSVGEHIGIESADGIEAVDGNRVRTLEKMESYLRSVIAQGQTSIRLRIKRMDIHQGQLFSYWDKTLPLGELSWVQ